MSARLFSYLRLYRRPGFRVAVLTALAAAASFAIGGLVPQVSGTVAAITALICVRPTFHASIQEGTRQIAGVAIGGAVSYGAFTVFGFGPVTILLSVLVGFAAAKALRMGAEAGVAIGVTTILVIGPSFHAEAIENRLLGVIVGGLVALLASLYAHPGTPHGRALQASAAQAARLSALLTRISASLTRRDGRVLAEPAGKWLAEAEDIMRETSAARADAEDALEGASWSPLIDRQEAAAVLEQARMTEAMATTVLSMCLDLSSAVRNDTPLPSTVLSRLTGVLDATAEAISEQSEIALEHPAEALDPAAVPAVSLQESRREAVEEIRELEDTQPLLLSGSLLRDTDKISDILSGR